MEKTALIQGTSVFVLSCDSTVIKSVAASGDFFPPELLFFFLLKTTYFFEVINTVTIVATQV